MKYPRTPRLNQGSLYPRFCKIIRFFVQISPLHKNGKGEKEKEGKRKRKKRKKEKEKIEKKRKSIEKKRKKISFVHVRFVVRRWKEDGNGST